MPGGIELEKSYSKGQDKSFFLLTPEKVGHNRGPFQHMY